VANRGGKGGKSMMGHFTKEHAYRDKEREERVEEDRSPVVCAPPFLAGRGRGER